MKVIQKITSWVTKARYIYWRNKYSRMKHITALIRMIEKESKIAKERSQGISGRLSQLKLSVKNLKESKKQGMKRDIERIERSIDELRTVFTEMANANDYNIKITAKRFDLINSTEIKQNDRITALEGTIEEFKKEIKSVFEHERNMKKIMSMQNALLDHRKDFDRHAKKICEDMDSRAGSYIKEFDEHSMSLRAIDSQFRNAMAIQCQDILRRVNQQLSPQPKPNGHVHQ